MEFVVCCVDEFCFNDAVTIGEDDDAVEAIVVVVDDVELRSAIYGIKSSFDRLAT